MNSLTCPVWKLGKLELKEPNCHQTELLILSSIFLWTIKGIKSTCFIPIILETERKENYASYTAIQKDYKNYTIGIIDFKSYIP